MCVLWLGSRIDFLGQMGTHVTITAWGTMLICSPFSLPSCFLPCLSLCFLSPPRRPYAGMLLSFVLLRPCSRYLSFLSTYDFRLLILK